MIGLFPIPSQAVPQKLSFSTGAASGVFIQTLQYQRALLKPLSMKREFFLSKHEIEELKAMETEEYFPLTWRVGLGFGYFESPARATIPKITDLSFSFQSGLDWAWSQRVQLDVGIGLDAIPLESYNHGVLLVNLWVTLPLGSTKKGSNSAAPQSPPVEGGSLSPSLSGGIPKENAFLELDLAEDYYERKVQYRSEIDRKVAAVTEDPSPEPPLPYPQLKLGPFMHFATHLFNPKRFSNPALGSLDETQKLNQTLMGLQAQFLNAHGLILRLAGGFWFYDQSSTPYLSYWDLGMAQRTPLVSKIGLTLETNQFSLFPDFAMDQGITIPINEKNRLELSLNETFFPPSSGMRPRVSGTLSYERKLSTSWSIFVEPTMVYSLSAGTAVLGMLRLSYAAPSS
ncbi:MAG: hypothetical protein ACO3A2_00665 [Bdellovibrionia bacterium]